MDIPISSRSYHSDYLPNVMYSNLTHYCLLRENTLVHKKIKQKLNPFEVKVIIA